MAYDLPPPPSAHGLPPAPSQPAAAAYPVGPNGLPPIIIEPDPDRTTPMTLDDMTIYVQTKADKFLSRLVKIIEDDDQPGSVHVSATKEWLDRAYGKPKQSIEVTAPPQFAGWTAVELDHFARTGERPDR